MQTPQATSNAEEKPQENSGHDYLAINIHVK